MAQQSASIHDDDAVVRAALAGDAVAMRKLLRRLGPHVLRTARRLLGHGPDAEDAAQEALIRIIDGLPALRDPAAVVPYANRITSRVAMRSRAKRGRRAAVELEHEPAARGGDPSAHAYVEQVLERLATLPPEQAEVVVLRSVLGHSLDEVAAVTDARVNTVRSRLRIAREKLLAAMGEGR